MTNPRRAALLMSGFALAWIAGVGHQAAARAASGYAAVPNWGQLAPPLKWGEVPNVAIDPKGTVFVFTRTDPPVIELTPSGKLVKTWGDGMFAWPHGIRFDRDGNLWITEAVPRTARARWSTSSTPTGRRCF